MSGYLITYTETISNATGPVTLAIAAVVGGRPIHIKSLTWCSEVSSGSAGITAKITNVQGDAGAITATCGTIAGTSTGAGIAKGMPFAMPSNGFTCISGNITTLSWTPSAAVTGSVCMEYLRG